MTSTALKLSHETISNIVDRIQPRVIEWQNRRLEKVYPFVYMDALMVNMKSDNISGKCAVYSIIGKARGVEKLGFVCIDGLAGLEEAITNTFPNAIVCRCMVHLVRNSTKYIPTKHRKEFCADLKAIYGAVSISEAENARQSTARNSARISKRYMELSVSAKLKMPLLS